MCPIPLFLKWKLIAFFSLTEVPLAPLWTDSSTVLPHSNILFFKWNMHINLRTQDKNWTSETSSKTK